MTFPLRWGPSNLLAFAVRSGWLLRMAHTPCKWATRLSYHSRLAWQFTQAS